MLIYEPNNTEKTYNLNQVIYILNCDDSLGAYTTNHINTFFLYNSKGKIIADSPKFNKGYTFKRNNNFNAWRYKITTLNNMKSIFNELIPEPLNQSEFSLKLSFDSLIKRRNLK